MRIAGLGHAFPPHFYDQQQLIAAAEAQWGSDFHNPERIRRLFSNVAVGGRHLALPLERYADLGSFGAANDAWIEVGTAIGAEALEAALDDAGLTAETLEALVTVSVTGLATPSLDARLMNVMPLAPTLKRTPIFGLGCVAGAAGLARAADYLRGHPGAAVALLSVELCSLTLQREDLSIANLIASGLFGDGAAAAVLVGAEHPAVHHAAGPRIVDTRASFYRDTEDVMGWTISERGFQIVLSAEVPEMVERHLRADVDAFLADHGLEPGDIGCWTAHTGGPRVLEAMESALELPAGALDASWRSLREVGNLSSTSVLLVLEETVREDRPEPGTPGLLMAMGPGFCSELVLLEW